MRESDIHRVVLFFTLLFVDEEQVRDLSHRTLSKYRSHLLDLKIEEDQTQLLSLILSVAQSSRREFKSTAHLSGYYLQWPVGLDFSTWMEFRKRAGFEEIFSIILVSILGFKETLVAEKLSAPLGTIHYRLSHGLRRLGSLSTAVPEPR